MHDFTDPQIATVGMTVEEAISAGHDCWGNTVPISLVPRAACRRDPRHSQHNQDGRRCRHRGSARCFDGRPYRWRGHPRGRHGNAFPRQDQRFYRTLARLSNDGRGAENNRHLTLRGSSKASPAAQSNTEESVEHTSSERLVVATMLTSEIVPNSAQSSMPNNSQSDRHWCPPLLGDCNITSLVRQERGAERDFGNPSGQM
jgi:hypothetical protein